MPRETQERPAPGPAPEVKRGPDGKFLPGFSPNPGGVSKAVREVREHAVGNLPKARALLERWLEGEEDVSEEQQRMAVQMTYERAVGKAPKPSELPPLHEPSTAKGATTEDLLARARGLQERLLGDFEKQHEAGDLGMDALDRLATLAASLGSLAKTEAELARGNGLSAMEPEKLQELVAQLLPMEALERMVAMKKADALQAEEKNP